MTASTTSFTDLGKETGLSTSAVHHRVKRLESRGLIKGYSATVDHDELGLPVTAFISIRPIDPSAPDGGVTVYPDGGVELPDGGIGSANDLPNGDGSGNGSGGDDGAGCSSTPYPPGGAWAPFGVAVAFALASGIVRRRRR